MITSCFRCIRDEKDKQSACTHLCKWCEKEQVVVHTSHGDGDELCNDCLNDRDNAYALE